MKKIIIFILCLYSLPIIVKSYAQKKSDFNLFIANESVEKEANNLHYIESRPTPDDLGSVYVNSWHGVQDVTLYTPIPDQFEMYGSTLPKSDNRNSMAVQLRMLRFSIGEDGVNSNKGLCHIRMSLYEVSDNDQYSFLTTIDTLVVSDMKKIREDASKAITNYISSSWNNPSSSNVANILIDQVYDIDVYEKKEIPFYTSNNLSNGIYKSYSALKELKPTNASAVLTYDEKTHKVTESINGKEKKINNKDAYAVVIDGESYINIKDKFYKTYRKDGDYRFKIYRKKSGNGGFSLGLGIGGGNTKVGGGMNVGIPISFGGKNASQEMIIDHLNGDFYWGDEYNND